MIEWILSTEMLPEKIGWTMVSNDGKTFVPARWNGEDFLDWYHPSDGFGPYRIHTPKWWLKITSPIEGMICQSTNIDATIAESSKE